jgi:alkanesulfonate monooxygenase SsuD/methylene tetrahydromethanopterin reductase-like flavin-dependent oxidoreductase (luciferase family)
MWREGLDFVVKAMTETPFAGYDGKYVSSPPRNVVPKPYQKPHPPLWMATSRRDAITIAAQNGLGALGFFFLEPEACREWAEHYFRVFEEEAVPAGLAPNPNFACVVCACAAETKAEAQARFADSMQYFDMGSAHYYRNGIHSPGRTDLWATFQESKAGGAAPDAPAQDEDAPAPIGSVDNLREYFMQYEEYGVDQLMLIVQLGGVKHEHIMETIERVGTEILPELHERHEAGEAERQERNERLVEKAMARKPQEDRTAPADYTFGVADTGMKRALDEIAAVVAGERQESRPQPPKVET